MVDLAVNPMTLDQGQVPPLSILPAAAVRGVVAWYEQEIESLTAELDAVLAAAEAERPAGGATVADVLALGRGPDPVPAPAASHVSAGPSPLDGFAALSPAPAAAPSPSPSPSEVYRSTASSRPRTTVVTRDRPPRHHPPEASGHPPAVHGAALPHPAEDTWTAQWKAHWMMKGGVVLALVGILLLKFG